MCRRRDHIRWFLFAVIAISLSVVISYAPTLTGEFLLDDHVLIENNPFIKQGHSLTKYFSQEDGILDQGDWDDEFHTGYYRPLINLTYFIDYRLWGMNPAGFRASNLVFHILACCTLYLMLVRFGAAPLAALGFSLLFALHPVNTEAVSWAASRNNILATFFSLSAFLCHTDTRAKGRVLSRILAVFFFALAIFSKEFGIMLLPILFIYQRLKGSPKATFGNRIAEYLPFLVVLTVYFWARSMVTGSIAPSENEFGLGWRIALAPYVAAYHLRLIFLPVGLHNFWITYPGRLWGAELVYGVAVVAMIAFLVWRHRNRHFFVFGVLSFLVGIFPVLNIIPTASATLVAMRWVYFPFAFLCAAFCPLASKSVNRKFAVVIVCAIVASGVCTFRLNRDHWHDDAVFFRNEVLLHQNYLYAGALAEAYWKQGDLNGAETYFNRGMAAVPRMMETRINYSAMLIEAGQPRKALDIIEKTLGKTMSRENKGGLYNNQGMALARLNRLDEAVSALETAIGYQPDKPDFLNNLGTAYGMRGEYEKAVSVLTRGLSIDPHSVGLKKNLAVTHMRTGNPGTAVEVLESIPNAIRQADPGLLALHRQAQAKAGGGRPVPERPGIAF